MHAPEKTNSARPWTARPNSPVRQHNSWRRFLRRPAEPDAIEMRRLVAGTGVLDVNSTYCLPADGDRLCRDVRRGRYATAPLCGLITGYHPPTRPEVLFVWQVAVTHAVRGTGLAATMLDSLVAPGPARPARPPRHRRSDRRPEQCGLTRALRRVRATSRCADNGEAAFLRSTSTPTSEHEDEPILRIGPIVATTVRLTSRRDPCPHRYDAPLITESGIPEVYDSVESGGSKLLPWLADDHGARARAPG